VKRGKNKRPTQAQIAEQVGTHVSTVNKILNKVQGPTFLQETIDRVWKVAQEVGYGLGRVNKHDLARALRQVLEAHPCTANDKACLGAIKALEKFEGRPYQPRLLAAEAAS